MSLYADENFPLRVVERCCRHGLADGSQWRSETQMENIADAAIAEGLTTAEEVSQIVDSLYEYAQDPDTFSGVPRVVQAWGRRPS
jgi:hypothetical protein